VNEHHVRSTARGSSEEEDEELDDVDVVGGVLEVVKGAVVLGAEFCSAAIAAR
jgi:hypothetical protein